MYFLHPADSKNPNVLNWLAKEEAAAEKQGFTALSFHCCQVAVRRFDCIVQCRKWSSDTGNVNHGGGLPPHPRRLRTEKPEFLCASWVQRSGMTLAPVSELGRLDRVRSCDRLGHFDRVTSAVSVGLTRQFWPSPLGSLARVHSAALPESTRLPCPSPLGCLARVHSAAMPESTRLPCPSPLGCLARVHSAALPESTRLPKLNK
ncbi:hypothetical protein H6P81_006542 [Aristolochia fimbriata]|uniref:Uncharacterized protein n=1 Tax=Aristolochia fimbriata TaxID=158543 RepID=A0AAV7EXU5_ARIFI|nr:hypothetical protein H6P81_006542 [Aristolochia fimbriata]